VLSVDVICDIERAGDTVRGLLQGAAHDCADCLIQHQLYRGVEPETAELTGYGQRENFKLR